MLRPLIVLLALCALLAACRTTHPEQPIVASDYVAHLLATEPTRFRDVLAAPREYRVQILVTKFGTAGDGSPTLERHGYRLDAEYFYPASAIELCAAVAALEKLDELQERTALAIDEDTPLEFQPLFSGETLDSFDASNSDAGVLTLRHLTRRALLASDSAAYNRLYDFVGQTELNERMWHAGLASAKLAHRLAVARSRDENARTPRVDMRVGADVVTVPEHTSRLELDNAGARGLEVGIAHVENGRRVGAPLDFRFRNAISLLDLQDALLKVARRDLPLAGRRFRLSDKQYAWLAETLTQYPRESHNPRYDEKQAPDASTKYLLPGLERVLPKERWRIVNKIGRAYGFSIENAYVEDRDSGRAFALSAVIYTNDDGVLNDDAYEYATVADPFLADLAEAVARDVLGLPRPAGATAR